MNDLAPPTVDPLPPLPFLLRTRLWRRTLVLGPPLTALTMALLMVLWSLVEAVGHNLGDGTWNPTGWHLPPLKALALFPVGGAMGVIAIPFLLPLTALTAALVVGVVRLTAQRASKPNAGPITRWTHRQAFWGGMVQGALASAPLALLIDGAVNGGTVQTVFRILAVAMVLAVALITGWSRHESRDLPWPAKVPAASPSAAR